MSRRPRPPAPFIGPPRPPRAAPDPHLRIALFAIFVATLLRLLWLAGRPIDLYPDEAQYWIWAQHPAWGYFSKPPVVAWMIWATTNLFGPGDLAVKAGAPLAYAFTSIIVFHIAQRLYDKRVAAWSAIAFVTLPAVSISAIIISTDVPLLFFWALATYGFVRAREAGGHRWWLLVGLAAGLGLLSKYAMGFWLGSALLYLGVFQQERRHLSPFLGAAALALLIYLPNLWWNADHGFVSYLHTEANANVHGVSFHPLQLLAFAASQFGVFGPIFLATLILIAIRVRGADIAGPAPMLLFFALPTLAVMLVVASLSRAQPNWSAPTYITATILVVATLSAWKREGLLQWSVVLHLVAAIAVLGARDAASAIGRPLEARYDPLHRLLGWRTLGMSVGEVRARYLPMKVMADERELMAALIYYMQPHPFEMVIWNPGRGVHNGFEMEQSLPDHAGGDYLWVTQRADRQDVFDRFESHEEVSHITVPIDAGSPDHPPMFRDVRLIVLHGFKGYGAQH